MKLFVVATISSLFDDEDYFGDILLVTNDEEKAKTLTEDYNNGKDIPKLNREHLVANDGKAVYFERTLNQTIITDDYAEGE